MRVYRYVEGNSRIRLTSDWSSTILFQFCDNLWGKYNTFGYKRMFYVEVPEWEEI